MAITQCGPACTLEIKNSGRRCGDPQQSHAGMVLETYQHNGYDDSDFFAVVWDGERASAREYASTRSWTYHNGASVDATSQVQAAALDWYRHRLVPHLIETAQARATAPRVGRQVRSLTQRGKNVGIVGEVRWIGPDRYDRDGGERVGIQIDGEDRLRFLPARSVAVLDPDPVDEQRLREYAATARPGSWRDALNLDRR